MAGVHQMFWGGGGSEEAPSVPDLPGLLDTRFYWDAQTLNADYLGGSVPPVYQLAGIPDAVGLPTIGTNPYDSQTWGVVTGAWDKWDWWIDTDDASVWGATTGKMWVRLRYMVETAFTADMLLFQISAKTRDPGNPLNGNAGIRLDTTTAASLPAIIGTNVTVTVPNSASVPAGTEFEIVIRYNKSTTNANAAILEALYVRRDGYATASGYSTTVSAAPDQPYNHNVQPGNDRITAGSYYIRGFYFGRDWNHDLPVSMWQDFNTATISQANLEANDHNDSYAWALTGTTTSFSTTASAKYASPSTINLYQDTGTYGLRKDLTATASGAVGFTNTDTSALRAFGMWVRLVQGITSGTTARIAYATNTTNSSTITVAVEFINTAGQHQLRLYNGTTASSSVDINTDTWYYVAWTARQSATCSMWVYDTTGAEVSGSGVTVTGANRAVGSGRIGSTSSYTAQSAGAYIDVSNFVFSSNATARLIPWAVSP